MPDPSRGAVSPLIRLSIGWHAVAPLLAWALPRQWPWIVAGLVADHVALIGAGLWPRSRLLGPNLSRLPAERRHVVLTFDDGPDPRVTPQVLRLLADRNATATFFFVGSRAAAHPELVREVVRRGHDVENHSYRHPEWFFFLGPGAMGREIDRTQDVLERLTSRRPRYFRAPAGLRNPWLQAQLDRRALSLVSWTRRGYDTMTRCPLTVARRLTDGLSAGDILLLHDGSCARDARDRPLVLEVLPRVLDAIEAHGLETAPLPGPVGSPCPASHETVNP